MKLRLGDKVGYQGVDYQVDGMFAFALTDRILHLARLAGGGQVRFVETALNHVHDRVLMLSEIEKLDITAPPPATIYYHGESYLLRISGAAKVTSKVTSDDGEPQTCTLWRYRAAGDQVLQIEQWPGRVRMLVGASVHLDMLEIRPATLFKDS
ncbi:MAG TPA: DUF4178 domain-containing protein [Polyangia bacterium]